MLRVIWRGPQGHNGGGGGEAAAAQLFQAALGLHRQGRLDEAGVLYRKVLAIHPRNFEPLYMLALVCAQQGRTEDAIGLFRQALAQNPNAAPVHHNLGTALASVERYDEAVAHQRKALALRPGYAEAHHNLAQALGSLGRTEEAVAQYEKAVRAKPDYAMAYLNLGAALKTLDRLPEAAAQLTRALSLQPNMAEAHVNLGLVLQDQGRTQDAADQYRQALTVRPDYPEARLLLCMAQLPQIYEDEAGIERQRTLYRAELERLRADLGTRIAPADLARAVGLAQPYYLAYQGRNDRDLQALYGGIVCEAVAARFPAAPLCDPPKTGEKIRVGFVSGFFSPHSNWKIPIKGWLTQLDRSKFELFGYYTGTTKSAETEEAAAACDRFVRGPLSADGWRKQILADAPHVLIYPEIGMDQIAVQLAAQRLARVQCNSWGHPDTSGFPTMDYYLGSDLMEPPGARDYYTERLVRLPNLSIYYEEAAISAARVTRAEFGFRPDATVYWSGQSLFKYLPRFDEVFAHIAQDAGDCQFAFIESKKPAVTDIFRARLRKAFAAVGLNADEYCVFLPRLDDSRFLGVLGLCDVFLDSFEWSGCNTTLESLTHNLPVVTMPGALMRGRHSAAILEMMGLAGEIAPTVEDYVAKAVNLARDPSVRAAFAARIAVQKSILYRDRSTVAALDAFLVEAASGKPA